MKMGGKGLRKFQMAAAGLSVIAIVMLSMLAFGEDALRVPEASGERRLKDGKVTADVSHADEGYIMVRHEGSEKKLKARVSSGETTYTYDLNGEGEWEVYPLQLGSGRYTLQVFQNVRDSSYSTVFSDSFSADMADENSAYLYPNQQVWFTAQTRAVALGAEICAGLSDDMDRVRAVYGRVNEDIRYDYIKALTVKSGYLPDVDETLDSGMGICFDYAALVACMLRAQGIPTRLVKGYLFDGTKDVFHAWNEAWVNGAWVFMDATMGERYELSSYTRSEWF